MRRGSDARSDAARGAGLGTRRLPAHVARALDLSGIYGGPEFIGAGLGALRRVRRVAAILRGDLLTPEDTLGPPTAEREPTGDAPDR